MLQWKSLTTPEALSRAVWLTASAVRRLAKQSLEPTDVPVVRSSLGFVCDRSRAVEHYRNYPFGSMTHRQNLRLRLCLCCSGKCCKEALETCRGEEVKPRFFANYWVPDEKGLRTRSRVCLDTTEDWHGIAPRVSDHSGGYKCGGGRWAVGSCAGFCVTARHAGEFRRAGRGV